MIVKILDSSLNTTDNSHIFCMAVEVSCCEGSAFLAGTGRHVKVDGMMNAAICRKKTCMSLQKVWELNTNGAFEIFICQNN